MSQVDLAMPTADAGVKATSRGSFGRLLRSELRLVLGRRRNIVLVCGLMLIPILVGVSIKLFAEGVPANHGTDMMGRITDNGFFLVFTSLFAALPIFFPLVVGIASGDAIAGEAGQGTLRYLLTIPVNRTKLLIVKGMAAFAYAIVAVFAMALAGLVTGAILFGLTDITLISGDTVGIGEGAFRTFAVACYVSLSLASLVAVGLMFSTLTEVPVAAMAATVVFAIASTVLDSIPQLSMIHKALPTHYWFDFMSFLSFEIPWSAMLPGLAVHAAWVAVAGSVAWARFTTADISS